MKTFEIEIRETLESVVAVNANNKAEALEVIQKSYRNEEVILTAENHVETIIEPYIYSEIYKSYMENMDFKNFIIEEAKKKVLNNSNTEALIKFVYGDVETALSSFQENENI